MAFGILAAGAYVPRLRLQRKAIVDANRWFAPGLASLGKGERAICNWDEDAITMAVEASRDALAGSDRGVVGNLYFASTTFPFLDRLNGGWDLEARPGGDEVEAAMIIDASARRVATEVVGRLAAARAA